jgi:hypothetical protein
MKSYTVAVDFWTDSHNGKGVLFDSVLETSYKKRNRFDIIKYELLLVIFSFFSGSAIVVLVFHI